jgi:hypothetical protein
MNKFRLFTLTILFFVAPGAFAYTGTSLNVPIGDPVYQLIDKLVASGLVQMPIYGHRPWTRLYVTKMVKEAIENEGKLLEDLNKETLSSREFNKKLRHKRFIEKIIKTLSEEYGNELGQLNVIARPEGAKQSPNIEIHPLSSISATYTYLDNYPSVVPQNGLGSIDAVVHPLVANRQGRQHEKGHHFYWETEHSAQLSKYFAAYARPQFQFRFPSDGNEEDNAYLHNLYLKTGWRDIELEIGRDQFLWGQGLHGGFMFSDNPRGLDMIKLSTPYPFRLPWVLGKIGEFKWTGFLANMGPEQFHKYSWLMGWRLDYQPKKWWDIGIESATMFNGEGTESLSAWDLWREFSRIPFSTTANRNTNRVFGMDMKWNIPRWRGLQIYGNCFFEDRYDTLMLIFGHSSAWMFGFYLPRFNYTGRWDLRAEFERVNDLPYHHSSHKTGWTLNRQLLGAILGPDSDRVSTTISYNFTPYSKITGDFSFLHKSSNKYRPVTTGSDVDAIVRSADGPEEYHILNLYKLELPLNKAEGYDAYRLFLNTSIGWDYVINRDFVQGKKKADLMAEIGLTMKFPEF